MRRLICLVGLISLLVACVALEPVVSRTAAPDSASAYIAGDFSRDALFGFAFTIRDTVSGKEYSMALGEARLVNVKTDTEVSMIKLPPGRYVIANWQRYSRLGAEKMGTFPIKFDSALAKPFNVEAKQIVYLGSFAVQTKREGNGILMSITPRHLTLQVAKSFFLESFPAFAEQAFECRLCVPPFLEPRLPEKKFSLNAT